MGPYMTIHDQTEAYWSMQDHTGPNGTKLVHLWPYGAIWDHTSKFGYYTCSWDLSEIKPTQPTDKPVSEVLCRLPGLKQQQQQGVNILFTGDGISGAVLGEEEKVLRWKLIRTSDGLCLGLRADQCWLFYHLFNNVISWKGFFTNKFDNIPNNCYLLVKLCYVKFCQAQPRQEVSLSLALFQVASRTQNSV